MAVAAVSIRDVRNFREDKQASNGGSGRRLFLARFPVGSTLLLMLGLEEQGSGADIINGGVES